MEEGKEEKNSSSRSDTTTTIRVPPSREDVESYCTESGIRTDIDAFISYNTARGWIRGKAIVKDWRPLLTQWINKDAEYGNTMREDQGSNEELDCWGKPLKRRYE